MESSSFAGESLGWLLNGWEQPVTLVFIIAILTFFLIIFLYNARKFLVSLQKIQFLIDKFNNYPEDITDKENFEIYANNELGNFSNFLVEYRGNLYLEKDCEIIISEIWQPELLNSHFLPAGPAILTGIGVLGTFVGLLMGLSDIDLNNFADIKSTSNNITTIINGAKTAFTTSVYGVFFSLVLTVFEKYWVKEVKKKLLELQTVISSEFPLFPISSIFIDIDKENRGSHDVLAGLAEQIGNRTQSSFDAFTQKILDGFTEALGHAGQNIAASISSSLIETLQSSLAPAIENISKASKELAERQVNSSEKALEALIDKFTDRLNEKGDDQRESMEAATSEMKERMISFSDAMKNLFAQVQIQNENFSNKQAEQLTKLEHSFEHLHAQNLKNMDEARENIIALISDFKNNVGEELARQSKEMANVSNKFGSTIANMGENLEKFFESMQDMQKLMTDSQSEQAKYISNQMEDVFDQQSKSLTEIKSLIASHVESTRSILDQGKGLQEQIAMENKKVLIISENLQRSSTVFEKASSNIENFGKNLQQIIDQHSQSIEKAASTVEQTLAMQKDLAGEIQQLFYNLKQLQSIISGLANELNSSSKTAYKTYQQLGFHYRDLQDKLQEHIEQISQNADEQNELFMDLITSKIEELNEQMGKLLEEFAQSASHHIQDNMNKWKSQTEHFFDTLESVVKTMADIIDTLDRPGNN